MKNYKLTTSAVLVALMLSGCASEMHKQDNHPSSEKSTATASTKTKESHNVIYVDLDAKLGTHNGTSWQNAYQKLPIALAKAKTGDQIWVAQGTYYPTTSDDRSQSFQVAHGVTLYGGFKGTETSLKQRHWRSHKTILSGNIGNKKTDKDNSYHVIIAGKGSVIDGVIVQDGYADGGARDGYGGGTLAWGISAAPKLENMEFKNNYAKKGGGAYFYQNGANTLNNFTFMDNSAELGGAIVAEQGSTLSIDGSTFKGNESTGNAGAVLVDKGAQLQLSNSLFSSNYSQGDGGAILISEQQLSKNNQLPSIHGTAFVNNHANASGGAIYTQNKGPLQIDQSFFSGNTSRKGASIANVAGGKLTLKDTQVQPASVYQPSAAQ